MNHIVQTVIQIITIPEVAGALATLAVALLVKSKILTEIDIKRAGAIVEKARGFILHDEGKVLDAMKEASAITHLKIQDVKPIVAAVKTQIQGNDTNRKKIQRAARAVLRGWLKF